MQDIPGLICGNGAIRNAAFYFRRLIDRPPNLFIPLEGSLYQFLDAAEGWLPDPKGCVEKLMRRAKDKEQEQQNTTAVVVRGKIRQPRIFYTVLAPYLAGAPGAKEDYRSGQVVDGDSLNGGPQFYAANGFIEFSHADLPGGSTTTREKSFSSIPKRLRPFLANEDVDSDFANSSDYYDWYAVYTKTWKPERVLEIGCRYGYSSLAMIWGSDSITDLAIVDNGSYGVPLSTAVATIQKGAGREVRIIPLEVSSQELSRVSFAEIDTFDLIHIDGDHSEEGLLHDLCICFPALSPDGVIVVDDVIYHPELLPVAHQFARDNGLGSELVPNFRGHLLLTRGSAVTADGEDF